MSLVSGASAMASVPRKFVFASGPIVAQGPHASTYLHRRMAHLTALQVLRLGAWSAVMLVHHKGRATTSEEPARPPEGSLFAAAGGRQRRLTMSRHRRPDASYPAAAKRRSYVPSSYESKYWWGSNAAQTYVISGAQPGGRHDQAPRISPSLTSERMICPTATLALDVG